MGRQSLGWWDQPPLKRTFLRNSDFGPGSGQRHEGRGGLSTGRGAGAGEVGLGRCDHCPPQ